MPNYRSGFERTLVSFLKRNKVDFTYETLKLPFVIESTYTPDFVLANGVIIEAKGVLDQNTRSRMLRVKKTYPDLDIRFCFMNGQNKIMKNSKTTYMEWAAKNGFPAADGAIPQEWLSERKPS